MIYIVLFFLFLYPVFKYDKPLYLSHGACRYSLEANIYYWFLMVLVILVLGLRNKVGADTYSYMYYWDYIPPLKDMSFQWLMLAKYQPFWYLLSSFCKELHSEFWFFQLVHATIVNVIIFYFIKEHSIHKFSVVFIFAIARMLYFSCEIMRESLSVCMFLLVFDSLVQKKWLKYYIAVSFAFMFHASAVFLFLLPLFYNYYCKKGSVKILVIISVIFTVVISMGILEKLLALISINMANSFSFYSHMEITPLGCLSNIINIFLLLYMYVFCLKRSPDVMSKIFFGMYLYIVFMFVGLSFLIIQTRITNYFILFYYIVLADFFWLNYRKVKSAFTYLIYVLFLYSTVRYMTRDVSEWVNDGKQYSFYESYYPYYSVFEDLPSNVEQHRYNIHAQQALKELKHEWSE